MDRWQLGMTSDLTLSDLCYYTDGRVPVADLDLDTYISTENMLSNKEGITHSAGLPTVSQTQAYQAEDILVSNIRPYFRKIWFANHVYPGFLYYLLSDDNFFNYATATAKGTKMPRGDKGAIMRYEVPDLPLETQIGIANTLSAIDTRIALNRTINHHLEQMAQAIFKSWFIDFELCGGVMPDNWRQGVLSDIAPKIYRGGTPSTSIGPYWNGNIPWLSSGETRDHFIIKTEKLITQNGVDNSSTRIAHRHDIVMASAGQGFTRGQTSLLLFDTYINQSVIVMSGQNPLYLFFNLSGRYDELRAISDSSSSRGSITTKMLAQLPMLIPSNAVISEFTTAIMPLVNQIENNLWESTRLVELRDTLLPRLISGELSVADIDAK